MQFEDTRNRPGREGCQPSRRLFYIFAGFALALLPLASLPPSTAQVSRAPFVQAGATLPASCSNATQLYHLTQVDGANAAGVYRCNAGSYAPVGSSGTVTGTGTANRLALWSSSTAIGALAAGTSTQVLHGSASGAPTFGAVSLTADVSGTLPGANGGTGSANFSVSGPTAPRAYTFPDANATVARTDAAQTFTGTQTFSSQVIVPSGSAGVGSNASNFIQFTTNSVSLIASGGNWLNVDGGTGLVNAAGGFGAGTTPGAFDIALRRVAAGMWEVNNGTIGTQRDLKLRGLQHATGTRPSCDSTNRGMTWYVAGGAGVADTYEICRKDAADAYAWVTLF